MKSPLPDIIDLLQDKTVSTWRAVKDRLGSIEGCVPYARDQKKIRVAGGLIDIELFAEVDPRFAGAIDKMYRVTKNNSAPHSFFVNTMRFWANPYLELPPACFVDDLVVGSRYAVSIIKTVLCDDGHLKIVYLNAEVVGDLKSAHYVDNTWPVTSIVSKLWLDENFPDWLERYKTGESIGMDCVQLAGLVLPLAVPVEVEKMPLPDLLDIGT